MSKTKRFDIHSSEPTGMTFTAHEGKFAGSTNTKRKAKFSLHPNSPMGSGGTFQDGPASHINFPHASTKPKDIVQNTTSGQGHYAPSSSAIKSGSSFTGRPGIGMSSPKKGSTITKKQDFRK